MPPPNAPILSVSELTARIKETLEEPFAQVWIRGEVSNLRRQSSGHVYFTLKDAHSQLPAVCFRASVERLPLRLTEGHQLALLGDITVYEPRGAYQLIVRYALPDGQGRLRQAFEALKAQLAAEGLFDPARKRPLPRAPRLVAAITSPTGAALRDIIQVLRRRAWGGRLIVVPSRVQGDAAPAELTQALARAQAIPRVELILLARGGGSLEDLWPFNDEALVRAVAASAVPTISAVGHQIDFALTDFAADLRAETPTAAAELLAQVQADLRERLHATSDYLAHTLARRLERLRGQIDLRRERLRRHHPQRLLDDHRLRLDDLRARLVDVTSNQLQSNLRDLGAVAAALHPRHLARELARRREALTARQSHLASLAPQNVLRRGYAIVRDASGTVLPRKASLPASGNLRLQFHDGEAEAHR